MSNLMCMPSDLYTNSVIAPVNTLIPDAKKQVLSFDDWLKKQTNNYVSLSTLAAAAGAIPVLGNVLAAVDVLSSVKNMMQSKSVDIFDWLDLGINVIGLIPGAGGPARVSLRTALKGVRSGLKNGVEDALADVLWDYINSHHKGKVDDWAKAIETQLTEILPKVGDKVHKLIYAVAEAIHNLAKGQMFDVSSLQKKLEAAKKKRNLSMIERGEFFIVVLALEAEIFAKQKANAATKAALPKPIQDNLYFFAANLYDFSRTAKIKINELASKLSGLIKRLVEMLSRKKKSKNKTGSTGGNNITNKKDNKTLESLKSPQDKANKKPSQCKCGNGYSPKSIDFATGQETFTHTDFTLPGIMPISWSRTYCSGLITYEKGELGARWITPYTSRIGIRKNELLYHTTDGRVVSFPLLEVGRAWHHPIEDFTLARIDKDLLTLNVGKDLLEIYERDGNSFRLSAIKDRNGNALGFHYSGSRLIAVNDSNGHTIGISYNEQGKISRIELLGENPRLLAAYEYSAEGDLVHATDEAGDVREYTYRQHLVTRYSDRTGRGVNL